MLSPQEWQAITARLENDAGTGLNDDDLERMLKEELARPEEEMDESLIRELLLALEEGVTEQEQQRAWKETEKKLAARGKRSLAAWVARIAAVLVIAVGLMFATYKTAEAFNWQLVLRLMRPIAETFTFYSGRQPVTTPEPVNEYAETVKVDEPRQYTSIKDAPDFLEGYPVKPCGMPERFAYLQGSCYSDDLNISITHVYMGGDGMCIFTVTILRGDNLTASRKYERTLDEPGEWYIAGCRVTGYHNSEDATMSASWTKDNAQYSVFGAITEEELARIVELTMTQHNDTEV